ncbi:hypothetical protein MLD38_030517 [Melastoma candidum]|uniref:Uncharacterized protein n=1 Tax=Melastoma candidum TaxID=119954 RepID=A0ACB9MN32_9MYRT|nr:hypothetical protein MLD38_030517 [Melastoma candidum]
MMKLAERKVMIFGTGASTLTAHTWTTLSGDCGIFFPTAGSSRKWHVLSMACDTGNSVSLLRVNSANSSQCNMFILQESCTDSTGLFIIYASVDILAMNVVLNGGDPDYVALLPLGFPILPNGSAPNGGDRAVGSGGSLLTMGSHFLIKCKGHKGEEGIQRNVSTTDKQISECKKWIDPAQIAYKMLKNGRRIRGSGIDFPNDIEGQQASNKHD